MYLHPGWISRDGFCDLDQASWTLGVHMSSGGGLCSHEGWDGQDVPVGQEGRGQTVWSHVRLLVPRGF
jgi:hypothetical protein